MNQQRVKDFETTITHESIKNQIDTNIKDGFEAINEYIWNSLDSGAKKIEINLKLSDNVSQDLFSIFEIKDNGSGIDFNKFIDKKFLTFNNSEKKIDEHKSLPHGHRGFGRFSFIKICKNIMWKSTYRFNNSLKTYKIFMESSNLLKNSTEDVNQEVVEETGTKVVFSNFLNPSDLIEKSKTDKIISNIKLEFAWITELFNIDFRINNLKLSYSDLFKKSPILETKEIDGEEFNIKLIIWNKKLSNYNSRVHIIDSNGSEKFTRDINPPSNDLNISLYIQSKFFNDYNNYSISRSKDVKALFGKEKTFLSLLDHIDEFLILSTKDLEETIIDKRYAEIINKPYFNEMFKVGLESDIKKPIVQRLTKSLIKIDQDLLKSKNDKQNKLILNLINNSLDSEASRNSLINVIKLLVNEDNKKSISDFEKEFEKYKLENIIATTKEIERRFKALKYFEKVIYDKDFYYYESDLQKMIEKNFWIFGEQYHLIGAENDKYDKLLEVYFKTILELDDEEIKNIKTSKKEVDLMISRKDPGFGQSITNTIIEIKRPGNPSNLKEKNLTQIKGYASDILKIKEFNSNNEEWIFILIGMEYDDDVKYAINNKSSLKEGLILVKPDVNQRIYVKKWSDILNDARYRMQYLKEKLEIKEKNIIEEVELEISIAKGDKQKFLDKALEKNNDGKRKKY